MLQPRASEQATPLDPVVLGVLLGIANVVVIAVGMEIMTRGERVSIGVPVFAIGLLPGVITGSLLGRLADRTRAWSPWLRCCLLIAPALAVVAVLAHTFDSNDFRLLASIPTIAAAMWLERGTRERRVLPDARAL